MHFCRKKNVLYVRSKVINIIEILSRRRESHVVYNHLVKAVIQGIVIETIYRNELIRAHPSI